MGLLQTMFDSARRVLFPGTIRRELLRQLAGEIGGTYVEGGFWKSPKVRARHRQWTVTLDWSRDYQSDFSRIRLQARYFSRDRFCFRIRGSPATRVGGILGYDLGKLFGLRDIEVGFPQFDHDFTIEASDEAKARGLFADPRIRQLLEAQPNVDLSAEETEPGGGVCELDCRHTVFGCSADVARLESLLDLFAETLDGLCRIGSAVEDRVPGPIRVEPDPLSTQAEPDRPPRFGRFGLLSVVLCVSFTAVGFAALRLGLFLGGPFVALSLPACGAGLGAAIGSLGEKSDWILAGALTGLLIGSAACLAAAAGLIR